VSLLSAVDLSLDESDDDVIINHLALLQAVGNALAVLALLRLLAQEHLLHGDVLPLELISKSHRDLNLVRAGHSAEEDSSRSIVGELLHNEVERVLGFANNKLLEHVLEQLVDLLLLEEALNLFESKEWSR